MLSFWTVVERALEGPICTEREFELKIFVANMRRVVEKYRIKFDPQNPVPSTVSSTLPSSTSLLVACWG